jgi:hypothetical protein
VLGFGREALIDRKSDNLVSSLLKIDTRNVSDLADTRRYQKQLRAGSRSAFHLAMSNSPVPARLSEDMTMLPQMAIDPKPFRRCSDRVRDKGIVLTLLCSSNSIEDDKGQHAPIHPKNRSWTLIGIDVSRLSILGCVTLFHGAGARSGRPVRKARKALATISR